MDDKSSLLWKKLKELLESFYPTSAEKMASAANQGVEEDRATTMETSLLLEEWKEIRESLRYFGNKRFAQLTVFIAASGFMLDAFLSRPALWPRLALSLVGLVLAALFLLMERSSVRYWKRFAERAVGIEWATDARLGNRGQRMDGPTNSLWLMRSYRPRPGPLSATTATYAVYWGVILLWIAAGLSLHFGPSRSVADPASALVAKALAEAPVYAGDERSDWHLMSITKNDSSSTYIVVLEDRRSGDTLSLTFDSESGSVRKAQKHWNREEPSEPER
jgi:hypothetical protein